MTWDRALSCAMGFVFGVVLVVIVVVYDQTARPVNLSIGSLAMKNADYSGRRVVVTNISVGEKKGRFIYFPAGSKDRHCVVMALAEEVNLDAISLRGYVVGVFEDKIPECPHDPPFLYVIDVRASYRQPP